MRGVYSARRQPWRLFTWIYLPAALLSAASLPTGDVGADANASRGGLPEGPLIVGYQNWATCNITETLTVAARGVNVVIWFAINLAKSEHGSPLVQGGPNYTCVAEARAALMARGLVTAHLISVGGWDAPHPDTAFTGEEWFSAWDAWNKALPQPFDGLDWDLEGNDKPASPSNTFKPAVLNLVIDMSVALKQAGYVVTMVPAQSYLDVTTDLFNRSLLNAYPDYHPDFHYHGLNCYAYILAAAPATTFDLVTVQLYESWSRADQALQTLDVPPAIYLRQWTAAMLKGWEVDFNDPALQLQGRHVVKISPQQLVVGLSFGSDDGKSVAILPSWGAAAYRESAPEHRPRGYAFWDISFDYAGGPFNGTDKNISLTSGLNDFLHVRQKPNSVIV